MGEILYLFFIIFVKMKILIATTIYQRHELTRIVLAYYKNLKDSGVDIELLCCGSEGDLSRCIADGWNYTEARNNPLAQKHNELFQHARTIPHDAIMLIGSDDLVSKEVIEFYQRLPPSESSMYGFNQLHFYSVQKKRLMHFPGYKRDVTGRMTMGAARLFSKAVLDKINYTPWGTSTVSRGLDTACTNYLKENRISDTELKLESIKGGMILDIKTEINITQFNRLIGHCNDCDIKIAHDKFPLQMKQIHEGF